MMIETAIISALAPAVIDGIRSVIAKYTGTAGAAPQNLDEVIRLMEAENARFKLIAELDKPTDNISSWVANLRSSFRYIAAILIILGTMAGFVENAEPMLAVTSFLFGERFLLKFKSAIQSQ